MPTVRSTATLGLLGLLGGALVGGVGVPAVQGVRVMRRTERLPEADGPSGRVGPAHGQVTRLVVVGDSVASGVGVAHHRESVAGQVAHRLAAAVDGAVEWQVVAHSGDTAEKVRALVEAAADVVAAADLVVVSVGVNDVISRHPRSRWRREYAALLDRLTELNAHAPVVVFALPPLRHFPVLPFPLNRYVGGRAAQFDTDARVVVDLRDRVSRFVMDLPPGAEWFARDGFHPSALLNAEFAVQILASWQEIRIAARP